MEGFSDLCLSLYPLSQVFPFHLSPSSIPVWPSATLMSLSSLNINFIWTEGFFCFVHCCFPGARRTFNTCLLKREEGGLQDLIGGFHKWRVRAIKIWNAHGTEHTDVESLKWVLCAQTSLGIILLGAISSPDFPYCSLNPRSASGCGRNASPPGCKSLPTPLSLYLSTVWLPSAAFIWQCLRKVFAMLVRRKQHRFI